MMGTRGARLDFSAQTPDNSTAKVCNLLVEEFDLDVDSSIALDLPVSWQATAIVSGVLPARVDTRFGHRWRRCVHHPRARR